MVPTYQLTIKYSARTIHSRLEHRFFSSFAAELIGLFVFFLLWLVGDAVATVSGPGILTTTFVDAASISSTLVTHQMSMSTGGISPRAGSSGSAEP